MKKSPTTEELIERGFASKNGKLEILFIYPATTVASRVAQAKERITKDKIVNRPQK